jgi:hypothetical protein
MIPVHLERIGSDEGNEVSLEGYPVWGRKRGDGEHSWLGRCTHGSVNQYGAESVASNGVRWTTITTLGYLPVR